MDPRLIAMLVCPVCKGPLEDRRPGAPTAAPLSGTAAAPRLERELVCPADRLAFPVRDGIPVMLAHEARALEAEGDSA